jgi:hypothetical protein
MIESMVVVVVHTWQDTTLHAIMRDVVVFIAYTMQAQTETQAQAQSCAQAQHQSRHRYRLYASSSTSPQQ